MSALYFGAGTDLRPLIFCNDIKNFNYIDSQPYSEFGLLQSNSNYNGYNGFYRPYFISDLDNSMSKNNMSLVNVDGNIRRYSDGNKNVTYYTNTSIPDHTDKVKKIIEESDYIIVAGYDPDSKILDYVKKKIHFIGCEKTCFFEEDIPENTNSIIHRLHLKEIQDKFSSYTFLQDNGKKSTFNTWDEFFKESRKF